MERMVKPALRPRKGEKIRLNSLAGYIGSIIAHAHLSLLICVFFTASLPACRKTKSIGATIAVQTSPLQFLATMFIGACSQKIDAFLGSGGVRWFLLAAMLVCKYSNHDVVILLRL